MNLINEAGKRIDSLKQTMNKNTYAQYSAIWRDFIHYLDEECKPPVVAASELKLSHIEFYLNDWSTKPSAYNLRMIAIFKLLTLMEAEHYPTIEFKGMSRWRAAIKKKKITKKARLFMNDDELDEAEGAIAALAFDRTTRERNILIFKLLRELWLRADEVALIEIADIDIPSKTLCIRGKGAASDSAGNRTVSATVQISDDLLQCLDKYLKDWRLQGKEEELRPLFAFPESITKGQYLFTSRNGTKLGVTSLKRHVSSAIKYAYRRDAKIPSSHGPHSIRRSAATIYYNATKDIVATSHRLRHSDLKTTMIYLDIKGIL